MMRAAGEMPEWPNGTDSKSVVPSRVPRVQIPISPPYSVEIKQVVAGLMLPGKCPTAFAVAWGIFLSAVYPQASGRSGLLYDRTSGWLLAARLASSRPEQQARGCGHPVIDTARSSPSWTRLVRRCLAWGSLPDSQYPSSRRSVRLMLPRTEEVQCLARYRKCHAGRGARVSSCSDSGDRSAP